MKLLRTLLPAWLLAIPASAQAALGMEIALIPKYGYVTPDVKSQTEEDVGYRDDDVPYRLDAGRGYAFALEFRHMPVGVDFPCGFSVSPEFLRYYYKATYADGASKYDLPKRAESRVMSTAVKFTCVRDDVRVSFGLGIGWVQNSHGYTEQVISQMGQFVISTEFGRGRVRGYVDLRAIGNVIEDDPYQYDRPYNGSGRGIFVGVSMVLRKLPVVERRERRPIEAGEISIAPDRTQSERVNAFGHMNKR